jgi:23S rRNA (uracil1939-C5)-methyltransferase
MSQPNAKNEFTLEIESLAYGPHGIGRIENQVVMVPATVPGDKISARITDPKGNYALGEVVRVLEPSPFRRPPPCPYVNDCGGCPWQQIQYDAQLQAKQQSVGDALRRIGKLDDFELRPIISSVNEYHYRRRIRLQLDSRKRLGFYRPSSHELVEIDSCLIAVGPVNDCVRAACDWVQRIHSPLEYVEIVAGDRPGEIVIVARSTGDFFSNDEIACRQLLEKEPGIAGLVLAGRNWRRVWGESRISIITEDDLRLLVEADVFTQVNSEGNQRILRELLAAGEFKDGERVLELYCGAGNFTLSLAKRAREVVAVEAHRPSVDSGKLSAQLNGLSNIRWLVSHVPAALKSLAKQRREFSKIVLDPPRAGAKGIESDLAALNSGKIMYVSCNPATLARDLAGLTKHGYKLRTVQPIDLFPHTFHVETLAVMSR